jgi:hypothetical protein
MKKLFYLLAIFILVLFGEENNTSSPFQENIDIKTLLELIHVLENKKTYNKKIENIKLDYNPFKIKKSKKRISEIVLPTATKTVTLNSEKNYNVEVIFQNRAKIDNIWYKNGDKLGKYTIIIKNGKVYLQKGEQMIKLERKRVLKVK